MADELTIDSQIYISSKRAADLSGYEQDYIGQLCRGGNIKARRVGGLWYVSADALLKYKERAEEYKPEPPITNGAVNIPDSLVSFEGKGYISTSRAAKMTGYSADYVGQMARAGTIPSRQVGNRWYVDQAGILRHKQSKDALLAAVQVEAVGLKVPIKPLVKAGGDYPENIPLYQYTSDNRMLMPSTGAGAYSIGPSAGESADFVARPADINPIGPPITSINEKVQNEEVNEEEYAIPIRVYHDTEEKVRRVPAYMPIVVEQRRAMLPLVLSASLFTVVIVLSFGFISLKKSSVYTNNSTSSGISTAQIASASMAFITKTADFLEPWIAPEIIYRRPK